MNNSNKKEKTQSIEKSRYCESKIINSFLESKDGISFLINSQNNSSLLNHSKRKNSNLQKKVDELIDFYTTWANSFPVRKNLKISKYEFLKSIENFCSKKEVKDRFERVLDI